MMPVKISSDGRLMPRIRPRNNEQEASDFWQRVKITGKRDCWNWTAGKNSNGYGRLRFRRRQDMAHRVAAILSFGDIPPGLLACHKCDNRICCNPAHLFLGTHKDNQHDCVVKGRKNSARGSQLPQTILNAEKVREIRRRYIPHVVTGVILGREFGVSAGAILDIVTRKRWKYVK